MNNKLKSLNLLEETENELDPEILELISAEPKDESFGAPISQALEKRMMNIVSEAQSKDNLDKLKTRILIPENCKFMAVPKVNPELWSQLPIKVKSNDARMQSIQQFESKSIATFALIAHEMTKLSKTVPKAACEKILKLCLDGATCSAMQFREINSRRMQTIKPLLAPNYSGICTTTSTSGGYLFGENFSETLKNSKSMTNVLKRNAPLQTNYTPRAGNLNWRGQPRQAFRGSFRGRPFNRGQYQQRYYHRGQFQRSNTQSQL